MSAVYLKLFVDCLDKYQKLNDTEFGRLVRAALRYKATGAEPDDLGREALLWDGMRLDIDRDNESYKNIISARTEAGKKGAAARWQTENKDSKNSKCHLPYGKNGQDKDKDKDKDKDISPPLPPTGKAAVVVSDYLNRINASASQTTIDELKAYAESMGPDVCKRAFDIALDSKKASWPYIRAILQDKQARGVKCLADWDALEERRTKPRNQNLQPTCDRTAGGPKAKEDMARMRRMLEKMREEDADEQQA